ncbi:unnamed protein product [Rotaria magnacalcarata]|nr:unnamed protein product [Rotaria magnacalcarata]
MLCIEISNFSHLSIDIHPQQKLAVMTLDDAHQLHSLEKIPHQPTTKETHIPDLSYSDLNENQKNQLTTLINRYPHVFTEQPGRTHMTKHTIELQPGKQPSNMQPYRLPPSKKQ